MEVITADMIMELRSTTTRNTNTSITMLLMLMGNARRTTPLSSLNPHMIMNMSIVMSIITKKNTTAKKIKNITMIITTIVMQIKVATITGRSTKNITITTTTTINPKH